jgi:NIPSNAP/TAT (twin-arginine translocation) pathway signal sequence
MMQRRDFLQTSLAATAACGLASAQTPQADGRHYYEWRTYRVPDAAHQTTVSGYIEKACLPAWQRLGVGPVGAFTEIGDGATPSLHVLLTYPSLAVFASAREALEHDAHYKEAAADYLAAKMTAPAFDRIDSSLLVAFQGAPKITVPATKPRVLEMRTYESHSEERARKKIDMFHNGEIPLFPKCGFENVFFGETLVGPALPNLKYMLAAPDMAANEAGWKKFMADPDFVALKSDPQYADTVSKIVKLFLKPTDYSQV